jgi:hypothetical protein
MVSSLLPIVVDVYFVYLSVALVENLRSMTEGQNGFS